MSDFNQLSDEQKKALAILRKPFPENQISMLPKPTRQQTDEVKNNFKAGIRCAVCGGWHHPKVVHLSYVGHAALTDRLLDADLGWSWEPLATNDHGLPALDGDSGLWIRLTVAGMTRIGYGDAQGKTGGDATKEKIGDALRNAAMRFGAALDLWHKGDLHVDDEPSQKSEETTVYQQVQKPLIDLTKEPERFNKMLENIKSGDFKKSEALGGRFILTGEQKDQIAMLGEAA